MIHRPDNVTLAPSDQKLLATWAVKTAMTLDAAGPEPIIPTGFFHLVRQRRAPLDSHWVWLGAYLGKTRAVHVDQRVLESSSIGFVTTFNIVGVVFQVAGHFTVGPAELTDTRRTRRGLWQIAPTGPTTVDWPRDGLALDDAHLDELASSMSTR